MTKLEDSGSVAVVLWVTSLNTRLFWYGRDARFTRTQTKQISVLTPTLSCKDFLGQALSILFAIGDNKVQMSDSKRQLRSVQTRR